MILFVVYTLCKLFNSTSSANFDKMDKIEIIEINNSQIEIEEDLYKQLRLVSLREMERVDLENYEKNANIENDVQNNPPNDSYALYI